MATGIDAEGHVALSLSADQSLAADIVIPERRIVLTRDKHSITIGRASKVSTKGFIATPENGWFESAVMSRLHAQIMANMDKKKVEVKDLGSLHGTYLNGEEPVPRKGFREVKDGDTIRFGVPIFRGSDQYAPITLKVGIRFSDHGDDVCTNTFQVPEGSDDDDSSDSDRDITMANVHTPATPSTSPGNAIPVVDLTCAIKNKAFCGTIIDLSSPPNSPIRIEDDNDDLTSDIEHHDDKLENATGDLRFSPASPDLGVPQAEEDMNDMAGLLDNDMQSMSEDSALCGDGDDTDIDSAHTESDIDYPDDELDEDLGSDEHDDAGSEGDEDMEGIESEDEYSSDDDNLSMNSLDDSFDLWGSTPQCPLMVDYPEIAMVVDSLSDFVEPVPVAKPIDTVTRSTAPVRIEGLLNQDEPQSPVPEPQQDSCKSTQEAPVSESQAKEGSPSRSFYTAPSYSFTTPATATVEVLGARTGKLDFFSAREDNKKALNAQKALKARPASSVHALCNEEEPRTYKFGPAVQNVVKSSTEVPQLPNIFGQLVEDSGPVHHSIGSPPLEPMRYQPANPCTALAMLRAPTLANLNSDGGADRCSRRTHVNIADLVNNCQQSPEMRKTKRNADDISDTTKEQELWASESSKKAGLEAFSFDFTAEFDTREEGSRSRSVSPDLSCVPEPQETAAPEREIESVPVVEVRLPERPAKRARMMRIAERVGYAALGGVTAGAMIVGTLIYTAPTFA